jgi:hypothetical protein
MKTLFTLMLLLSSACFAQSATQADFDYCNSRSNQLLGSAAYKSAFLQNCLNLRILKAMDEKDQKDRDLRKEIAETDMKTDWILKRAQVLKVRRMSEEMAKVKRTPEEMAAEDAETEAEWTAEQLRIKEVVRRIR